MNSELVPYQVRSMRGKDRRQLGRTLDKLNAEVSRETARIEGAAEIQATRSDAVAYVGKRAMQDVALMSQIEQQLGLLVPAASGRLQLIADVTAMSVAEVVGDTLRQVR